MPEPDWLHPNFWITMGWLGSYYFEQGRMWACPLAPGHRPEGTEGAEGTGFTGGTKERRETDRDVLRRPFDWSACKARRQAQYRRRQIQAADGNQCGLYLLSPVLRPAGFGGPIGRPAVRLRYSVPPVRPLPPSPPQPRASAPRHCPRSRHLLKRLLDRLESCGVARPAACLRDLASQRLQTSLRGRMAREEHRD
jgi:hypothetical protein